MPSSWCFCILMAHAFLWTQSIYRPRETCRNTEYVHFARSLPPNRSSQCLTPGRIRNSTGFLDSKDQPFTGESPPSKRSRSVKLCLADALAPPQHSGAQASAPPFSDRRILVSTDTAPGSRLSVTAGRRPSRLRGLKLAQSRICRRARGARGRPRPPSESGQGIELVLETGSRPMPPTRLIKRL